MFLLIPRSRKGLIVLFSILLIVCIAATVVFYFTWSADQQALKENGQPDFNTLSQDELKDGLIVKGSINLAMDVYAEEYETTVGIRTDEDSETLYYLIPISDIDEEGYINIKYFITYKAGSEDFNTMDAIVAQTSSDTETTVELNVENARIAALPANIKGFFKEWAEDPEIWSGATFYDWCAEYEIFGTSEMSVIESKVAPFMIDKTATAGTDPIIMWLFLGFAGLCLIVLLVLLLRKKPISGIINNTGDPDIMRPKQ